MAKRTVEEKEITDYLQREGFKEIKIEKTDKWYEKASKRPPCLKVDQKRVKK
jgi:hypothetical protein